MYSKTHRFVMENAIDIVSKNSLNPLFKRQVNQYKRMIMRGNVEEDRICKVHTMCLPLHGLGMSHFYDPNSKKGQLFDLFGNAKDMGIKRYNKAKKAYLKGRYMSAYYHLGGALHFIADSATPVHIHLEPHVFDNFERYLNNNFKKVKINQKVIKHKNIEDYYHHIATAAFRFRADSSLKIYKLLPYLTGEKKRLTKKEAKEQAEFLLPLTISYTAGLMEHFFQDVEKEIIISVKN